MNPKPILGSIPDLEIDSGSPVPMGITFFSVTHKIGLFSPKIEAIRIALRCRCHCAAATALPPLLLLLLPPPQAAMPAPPPLPLIRRSVVFYSRRVLIHPVF
jgi:hypothetical protein